MHNIPACCEILWQSFPSYRYSAVRRQFGPPEKDEIPVLEYQMQVDRKKSKSITFCGTSRQVG